MSGAKPKAVVVVSGGLDSAVTAALAAKEHTPCFFHLNYGQLTEATELKTFSLLARHFEVPELIVAHTNFFTQIGGASITDPTIPVSEADLDSEDIPSSYTPFRNGVLLAMAAAWAERIGAESLWYGAVEEDSSGYPDCRESFVLAFAAAIEMGTRPDTNISLETPLIHMSKADIVKLGEDLNVPFQYTWSCYKSNEKPCGTCDSCALRARGFDQAGLTDPLERAPENAPPAVPFASTGKGDQVWDPAREVKINRLKFLMKALVR